MKRLFVLLLAALLYSLTLHAEPQGLSPSAVRYHADENSLSVNLQNEPLATVLDEIARQSGMRLRINAGIGSRVNGRFERRDMADALKSLLRGTNYFLVVEQKETGKKSQRVSGLHVLASGTQQSDMLISVSELNAADIKQQKRANNAQRRLFNQNKNRQNNKGEKSLEKIGKRIKRFEKLKGDDPEKYAKKIANLKRRYPELTGEIDALLEGE